MTLLGQNIGNIRVDALLGSGGMGEVYRGFDVRLERHVAVKRLRTEFRLDGEVKARFLREARILSRLESSAICRVFDLVEGEDADYLIFEYVEGETLRQLMERRRLAADEALLLAEKIALALAVAHEERIVHRDLKPENVMVTPDGGVKILDFGISHTARDLVLETAATEAGSATEDFLSPGHGLDPMHDTVAAPADHDHTEQTRQLNVPETVAWQDAVPGAPDLGSDTQKLSTKELNTEGLNSKLDARLTEQGSLVGTLAYMSPEQAKGLDLTEASDMFSFGLVLQEMLTGQPAYGTPAIAKLLIQVARGETVPMHAEGLDPDAARLTEQLLRVASEARPTASQCAERLRWVLDRPKRRRRRKQRQTLASVAFVILLGVLTVVSILAVRADRAADRAEQQTRLAESEAKRANDEAIRANQEVERAQEVADFLVQLFEAASPEKTRGREVSVREILEVGSERIDRELASQPLLRARLKDTLGTLHWKLGDYPTAERLLSAALEIRRQHLPPNSSERAESKRQLAALFTDQGRLDLAEPLLRNAIDSLADSEAAEVLAGSLNDLATLLFERGEFEQAEVFYRRSLESRQVAFGADSIEVARSLNNLAVLAWQLGDYTQASAYYERSLAIHERVLDGDHPDLAPMLNNLGILHRHMGNFETSEGMHRRALELAETALGGRHPNVAAIVDSLARLLVLQNRLDEAKPLFEKARDIRTEVLGDDSYELGRTLTSLGDLLRRQGDLEGSRATLERADELLATALGKKHPWTLEALHALANLYRDAGERSRAATLYDQALARATEVLGAEHPEVEAIRQNQQLAVAGGSVGDIP